MTNPPTPKAAQEHRCIESFHHGGSAILLCSCDTVSKGSDFVEAVNAWGEHVLAASRSQALRLVQRPAPPKEGE